MAGNEAGLRRAQIGAIRAKLVRLPEAAGGGLPDPCLPNFVECVIRIHQSLYMLALCIGVVCIARPLLFASVDEAVAAARGLPVRVLGIAFLALVGVCAAEATQAVGALLLVGLVAAPAGAAHRLTGRPWIGLALSTAIAVGSVWLGLLLSYLHGSIPASFSIMAVATSVFAATFVRRRANGIVRR